MTKSLKTSTLQADTNRNVTLMTPVNETPCQAHEEQIQENSRKIVGLEARADYKEDIIKDIKVNMKELKDSVDTLGETINNFVLKSVNDDSNLRELVNKQDNRITALETTNKTLKWVIGIGFTALTGAIGLLTFLLTHIH